MEQSDGSCMIMFFLRFAGVFNADGIMTENK